MGEIITINTSDQLAETIEENDTVLLDFYADWCPPCITMNIFMEEIADETDYTIGKIDTEQHDTLLEQYNIRGIPHILVIHHGTEVKRFTEMVDKQDLVNALNNA